jgi:hypothetical protein
VCMRIASFCYITSKSTSDGSLAWLLSSILYPLSLSSSIHCLILLSHYPTLPHTHPIALTNVQAPQPPLLYSHTFENKSSFPPNPPAGLDGCVVVCWGAALLQPPKSSSPAAAGAPQPGLLGACAADIDVGAAAGAGAGAEALEPQTSLLPQASMLEKPE